MLHCIVSHFYYFHLISLLSFCPIVFLIFSILFSTFDIILIPLIFSTSFFSMDDVFGPSDPLKSWYSAPILKSQNSERDRIKRVLGTSWKSSWCKVKTEIQIHSHNSFFRDRLLVPEKLSCLYISTYIFYTILLITTFSLSICSMVLYFMFHSIMS